jgi:hypothetical protein
MSSYTSQSAEKVIGGALQPCTSYGWPGSLVVVATRGAVVSGATIDVVPDCATGPHATTEINKRVRAVRIPAIMWITRQLASDL